MLSSATSDRLCSELERGFRFAGIAALLLLVAVGIALLLPVDPGEATLGLVWLILLGLSLATAFRAIIAPQWWTFVLVSAAMNSCAFMVGMAVCTAMAGIESLRADRFGAEFSQLLIMYVAMVGGSAMIRVLGGRRPPR